MGFEYQNTQLDCGCINTVKTNDFFNYSTEGISSFCAEHLELDRLAKERRRIELEAYNKQCQEHINESRNQIERQQKLYDDHNAELRLLPIGQSVPLKRAIEKTGYKRSKILHNKNLRELLRVEKIRGRYYCDANCIDLMDTTRLVPVKKLPIKNSVVFIK